MVMSPAAADQVKALAAELAAMKRRITQLEANQNSGAGLANSSIENDFLTINDANQNPQIVLGAQPDGTFAHVNVSDTPPPQAPSTPTVTPAVLSAMVAWDGNQADGSNPLADFAGCQVHCSPQPSFTPGPNTLQSTFIAMGVRPIGGLLAGQTYYICTVIINQAGLTGPPSPVVPVVPNSSVSPGQVITQPVLIESTTLGYATSTPRGPEFFDFEFGLQGFTLDAGVTGTLTTDTSLAFTGNQAALITTDGLTQPVIVSPTGVHGVPVVAGDPVWVQFIYQGSINLGATYVGIRFYDINGNFVSETDVGPAPVTGEPGQWWAFSVGDIAKQAGFVAVCWGDQEILPAGTQIWVDSIELAGNLGFSFSANTGVDAVGNTYNQGITVYGQPGLQTAIAIKDPYGQNTNGAIDGQGNFIGGTMVANTDVYMGGQSFTNDILPPYPLGLVAYVGIPAASLPYPSTPTASTISVEELDFQAVAGRRYMLVLDQVNYQMAASGGVKIMLYGTTDGSAPTTSGPLLCRGMSQRASDTNDWTPAFTHQFTSLNGALWRILLCMLSNGTSSTLQLTAMEANPGDDADGTLNCRLSVYDMGIAPPLTGVPVLSTSGGGGTTKQTYTKTYNIVHTYSYQGSDGGNSNLKINTDGTAYQGGDYANTYNGRAKTWFSLPSAMGTDLSGATLNWAKMYLNNNHSWYNSGMTLSLGSDNKTSWGSTASDPSATSGYMHVSFTEGQAKWFTLPNSNGFWTALRNPGSNSLVMWWGDNNLTGYGYFAGAGQSGRPQLQVNYTK
jgi:hypothetical protein